MEYKIKKSIASNIKESYSIEGEDAFQNIDIDCAEGINTVSFSDYAIEAFNSIDYTIMKDYPHSLTVKKSIIDFHFLSTFFAGSLCLIHIYTINQFNQHRTV